MTAPALVPERPAPQSPLWLEGGGFWLLTRYADVARLLETPDTRATEIHPGIETIARRAGRDYSSLALLLSGVLIFRNPPQHTVQRLWLARCMATIMTRLTEGRIADLVASRLDSLGGTGGEPVDGVADIADRIPILVLADAMGLSAETVTVMHANGKGLIDGWQRAVPLRVYAQLQIQSAAIETALAAELERARRDGGPLKALIELAPDFDDRILIAGLFFLVMAGIETTAGLLGSVMWFDLARPGETATPQAFVDEALRLAPAFRLTAGRRLSGPMRFGEVEVPAGHVVVADLAAAHCDPDAFPDPRAFRPGRSDARLLVFGSGAHACLGNHLARLEARVLLEAIRARGIRLAGDAAQPDWPDWDSHPTFCRLRRLPLHFTHVKESCL